jgi:hypothetical protein
MYELVKENMNQAQICVEYHLRLWLLLHMVKHDLSMVIINLRMVIINLNIVTINLSMVTINLNMVTINLAMVITKTIPRDQLLLDDHHHNHPEFDVVNVAASLTMHPPVIVLNVVPDVKLKLFVFVFQMVLVCTTVCF